MGRVERNERVGTEKAASAEGGAEAEVVEEAAAAVAATGRTSSQSDGRGRENFAWLASGVG